MQQGKQSVNVTVHELAKINSLIIRNYLLYYFFLALEAICIHLAQNREQIHFLLSSRKPQTQTKTKTLSVTKLSYFLLSSKVNQHFIFLL